MGHSRVENDTCQSSGVDKLCNTSSWISVPQFLVFFSLSLFFQILFEKFLKGNWPGNEGKESEGNECNTFPRWNQSRDVSVCMVCILAPRTVL